MGRWLDLLNEDSKATVPVEPLALAIQVASPTPSQTDHIRDEAARERGWLILSSGMAYEQTLNRYAALYLLRDDETDTWHIWRGTWQAGQAEPLRQKTIAEGVGFAQALARGSNYVAWYRAKDKPSTKRR